MSSETRIKTTGTIVRKGSGHSFIATLPNGKEVVAFPTKELADHAASLTPGSNVTLELTVYDFSKARISSIEPS